MKKILIIEDEEDIQALIEFNLKKDGFQTEALKDGLDAISQIKKINPDLILLDVMLPGLDGFEILRRLKMDQALQKLSVILVTAKNEDVNIVSGLELGADDYITKPFSPAVLVARVRSVLRRKNQPIEVQDALAFKDLKIYKDKFKALVKEKELDLTTTEFKILIALAEKPGRVFTRYQLVDAVKGEDYVVTDRIIDVMLVSLRKKLGKMADLIETVRGVGYRFKE